MSTDIGKKRKFLVSVAAIVAGMSIQAQTYASSSELTNYSLPQYNEISNSSLSLGNDFILKSADSAKGIHAAHRSHWSHGSHGSHRSHSSHYSSYRGL